MSNSSLYYSHAKKIYDDPTCGRILTMNHKTLKDFNNEIQEYYWSHRKEFIEYGQASIPLLEIDKIIDSLKL